MQFEIEAPVHVRQIAVAQLKPHPLNREIYGDPLISSGFKQLVKSVRFHGILEPLLVNTDFTILSGHRRAAAALEVGLPYVPVRVLKGLTKLEQDELIVVLNQHRNRQTSIVVREAIVLERNGHEQEQRGALSNDQDLFENFVTSTGMESKRLFAQAKKVVLSENEDLIALMDHKTVTTAYRKLHRSHDGSSTYSSLIKPSDNWNFSPIKYPRIDSRETSGYIPGDVYANCFWYFAKPGDCVVDPMAGSGMARYVYDHRQEWMGEHPYDFDLTLFDLTPQAEDIKPHDLLSGFPTNKADYIFLDLPYMGMSKNAYSKRKEDLANMDEQAYRVAVHHIAQICSSVQTSGQLCTVISPNYTDHQQLKIINMTEYIRDCWRSAGYVLYLETYASRRIQQSQNPTIARLNNIAKKRRIPLTDITLIMTFQRRGL